MLSYLVRTLGFALGIALAGGVAAPLAVAGLVTFDALPAGTVVAGELPGGGSAPGTALPGMTLGVLNAGGGPASIVVFDSENPTGEDADLGTPNQAFGGLGIGAGGAAGEVGENAVSLGRLLIIAEDIEDTTPADGLVDDPDDEAGGGVMTFDFDHPVIIMGVVLVDIDSESVQIRLENMGSVVGSAVSSDLGENSVQTVDVSSFGAVTRMVLEFSGSGGLGEFEFVESPLPVESASWGRIKSLY